MLITPPAITKTDKTPSNNIIQAESIQKPIEIVNNNQEQLNPIMPTKVIRLKKQYRDFMKLIKANKFVTAIQSARIIGVDQRTISEWLETPKALKLMNETSDKYIKDIEQNKDWKAKAYLLDKIEGTTKDKEAAINLTNLIQVNTIENKKDITGDSTL